jgi:hypothetical protein
MMHAPNHEQRQLQRRLSMLCALQQETIKLERKQRQESRNPNLFFRLTDSDKEAFQPNARSAFKPYTTPAILAPPPPPPPPPPEPPPFELELDERRRRSAGDERLRYGHMRGH